MRSFIQIVESAQEGVVPTPQELSEAIRAKTAEIIAAGHSVSEYEINSGMCDTLAEEVVDSLGGDSDKFFTVWGDNLTAVGGDGFADGRTWDVELLHRISPGTHPTHGLTWADLNGHIPNHCWIVLNGRHYDSEAPDGVDNLFDLPICRRMIRDVLIEKTEREHESDRVQDAIEQLDAQVDDLKKNWVPHAGADKVASVMADLKKRREVLQARLAR